MEPYKVKPLVSIYAKKDRNGPASANQVISTQTSPDTVIPFAPFVCTYPPPPILPLLEGVG